MVCACAPASAGGNSCAHRDCLNGMLNLECHPRHCPAGKECKNQRFQRRQYAAVESRRAGPKGFGLFAKQPIAAKAFILEYVGEARVPRHLPRSRRRDASGVPEASTSARHARSCCVPEAASGSCQLLAGHNCALRPARRGSQAAGLAYHSRTYAAYMIGGV